MTAIATTIDIDAIVATAVEEQAPPTRKTDKAMMSDAGRDVRYRYMKMLHGLPGPDDERQRIFHRGRMVEEWLLDQIEFQSGLEVERQVTIPSPMPKLLADGHADAVIDGVVIEVKSMGSLAHIDTPIEEHLLQLAAYVNFGGYERGQLIYIDPATLQTETYTVHQSDDIKQELLSDLSRLEAAVQTGELPPKCHNADTPSSSPCTVYYGRRKSVCPFAERCWGEYEDTEIPTATDHTAQIARLAEIERERAQMKTRYDEATSEIEHERDELRDLLRPVLQEAGGEVVANGYRAKLTEYERSSFAWKKAVTAGVINEDVVGDFVSRSTSERWTVKEIEDD